MKAIEMNNFSVFYQVRKEYVPGISNINLVINRGEFIVLVGESGSGKSTFIKACLGMVKYYNGKLFINESEFQELDLANANMALVHQDISLYPSMTVYENIAFPLRVMNTPQSEVDKRVKEIASFVEMDMFLTRKPKQLSGGQQQRVAIARALIKNPNFIFFDEPFSNVSHALKRDLRLLIKKIHDTFNPTIVFVTHDMIDAFNLGDKIIIMNNGSIEEMGSPEYLRKHGKSELVQLFVRGELDGIQY